jgi:hypothetical protein
MPFSYESLKQVVSVSVIDGTIQNATIGAASIGSGNIAANSVSSAKIAGSAVNLASSTVTGVLPFANGGLANSSFGGAYRGFRGDGSFRNYGIYGISVYTGSSTWSRPTDVRYVKVCCQGGGGGGSGHGESGGGGGYSELVIDVRSISSVSVSIGGDSGGSFYSGAGGQGSSVSFGPYCSASGGYGANQNSQHCGGLSGVGSGGNLNIYGGGGANHHQESGFGGSCFFGGSVAGGYPNGGNFSHNHQSHATPGSGGAGGYYHGHYGSNGKSGMIVVYMYY